MVAVLLLSSPLRHFGPCGGLAVRRHMHLPGKQLILPLVPGHIRLLLMWFFFFFFNFETHCFIILA